MGVRGEMHAENAGGETERPPPTLLEMLPPGPRRTQCAAPFRTRSAPQASAQPTSSAKAPLREDALRFTAISGGRVCPHGHHEEGRTRGTAYIATFCVCYTGRQHSAT